MDGSSGSATTEGDASDDGSASAAWAALWARQIRQEEALQPDGRFSWDQVSRLLATLRSKFATYSWRSVSRPRVRPYTDPATGKPRVRVYYLIANDCLGQTLWFADVDPTADAPTGAEPPEASGPAEHRHRRLVNLATIKAQLLASGVRPAAPISRDEELLQERKRSYSTGITDYDVDPASGTLVFGYQNFVCHFVDRLDSGELGTSPPPAVSGIEAAHAPLNLTVCPGQARLVAYAAERTVYCVCLATGETVCAYSLSGCSSSISVGLPPFAVQEEFDRFLGFWWRPVASCSSQQQPAALELIVEVVDESAVESISIVDPLKGGREADKFAYPRAGTANAVSRLALVRVAQDSGQLGGLSCCAPVPLPGELGTPEPSEDREYLVRVEWSSGGELLLAQVMNRGQDRLRLLAYVPGLDGCVCLMEEVAPQGCWIEVHDLLKVLTVSTGEVTLLWASDASGYRHLYHVTCAWRQEANCARQLRADCTRRQLTSGDWQVQPDHLAVDEAAGCAYFNATAVDPRCVQLCRVSYRQQQPDVQVLTQAYMGANQGLPKTCSGVAFPAANLALLTVHCSRHSPQTRLCRLSSSNVDAAAAAAAAVGLPTLALLTWPIDCDNFFLEPEYFEFRGVGGQLLYGLLFRPFNYQVGQQYPTLQYVYGGPHVQLVTNTFVGFSFHRVTKACYFGYCVLIVDNRGSENRGRQFAAEIRHRLGALELPDQVAGLQFAARQFGCVDLNRVGLFGWSYGGYLALIGMRDFNHVYRLGVAGAPVTEWDLYDTAYTERYLGLPDGPGGRYEAASAIGAGTSGVGSFPGEANRLLIVHGSIDENVHFYHTARLLDRLAAARKPYSLLIYPSERHGLRNAASKDHFEISLMHFLCQNL